MVCWSHPSSTSLAVCHAQLESSTVAAARTDHVSGCCVLVLVLSAGILNGGVLSTLLDCHGNWTAAIALMDRSCLPKPPLTLTASMLVRVVQPNRQQQQQGRSGGVKAARGGCCCICQHMGGWDMLAAAKVP